MCVQSDVGEAAWVELARVWSIPRFLLAEICHLKQLATAHSPAQDPHDSVVIRHSERRGAEKGQKLNDRNYSRVYNKEKE